MKIVVFYTFILFLSTTFAQTQKEFRKYTRSVKVKKYPRDSIKKILKKHGYDLKKKYWVKQTMSMNKLSSKKLKKQKKPVYIYLPPKISYDSYSKKGKRRSIASKKKKKQCRYISRKYLTQNYKIKKENSFEYFRFVTSRKFKAKKGDRVSSILKSDNYSYESLKKVVQLVKVRNRLKSNLIKKDKVILLPSCVSPRLERNVAQLLIEKKIKKKKKFEKSPFSYSMGLVVGTLNIQKSEEKLDMKLTKASFKVNYKLNSTSSLSGSFSGTSFIDIQHSRSDEKIRMSSMYPEFGVTYNKKFESWGTGIGYDMLSYFLVTDDNINLKLDPKKIHRLSFKPYIPISRKMGLFASMGYIKGSSSDQISGTDASLGGSYMFGKKNKYSLSPVIYRSTLSVGDEGLKETSDALVISFGYKF